MKYLVFVVSILLISSCAPKETELSADYLTGLENWKSKRLSALKKPMGYLSMVGLHFLKEGANTIGANKDSDIILPKALPQDLLTIYKNGGELNAMKIHKDLTLDGASVTQTMLLPDSNVGHKKFNWGSYYLYIIKTGDRYGLRIKDTLSDLRINMASLPYFKPNEHMIIEAEYIAPAANETTDIKNHVGVTYQSPVKGKLRFSRGGKDYEMTGSNGGNNSLFLVFGDETNGEQTYGGGRFLYVDIPANGEKAILDFNRAENPICAMNDFAYCPYPPAQNILDFPIEAGELKVR